MIFRSTIVAAAMLAAHPAAAEDHRFEADPVATVHENFVTCEVLSQFATRHGESPLLARRRMLPTARRRTGSCLRQPRAYACIYPHDTIAPCKWTHQKVLSKRGSDEQRKDAHVSDTT
jgi:hypothetical protein